MDYYLTQSLGRQILEKSKTNQAVGAAVTLGPNAMNILASWGFDLAHSRGVPTAGVRTILLYAPTSVVF